MRSILSIMLIPMAFLFTGCYVAEQGFHYIGLLLRAVPAERVIEDPRAPELSKELLQRAERIRRFARERVGLADTKNYKTLVELKTDSLAYVVQACAELSFERKLWSYPIVGKLPYRGYFARSKAEAEAARLKAESWDVLVREVDAFSTLGFFPDPLWSFMSGYTEAQLAELIIHELCHATAFKKGADSWNEGLANFVGRQGAAAYLEAAYGAQSQELAELERKKRDAARFADWLKATAHELEGLYSADLPPSEKRRAKAEILSRRAAEYREKAEALFEHAAYRNFPMDRIDNAYLDLYRLYEDDSGLYEGYFRKISRGELSHFMAEMAKLSRERGDPAAAMKQALEQSL